MFYTTESSSQRNDCSLTNFTKNKPSILDCKRFIREKCAAGYLSRDSTMTPVPSGDDTSERCGICNKTMEDLKNMMREKYGDDWENELKAEYRDPIKTVLHDLKRNKMIESRKKKEFNFQAKFEESLKYDEKIIGNNSKKNGPQIQIFITEPKEVKLVSTPDRHFAVFANEIIRAFTKFGPFQGEPRTAVKNSDSYWQYTGSNNQKTIIDGQNCFKSNWMSRIRKNRTEANCVAYVSNDEIYYVALMDITKGEEIIVHEDIFTRNNENNGSDDKPDDDKDVPDDGSVEKSDGDNNGDDGGDKDDNDGNKNDDDGGDDGDDGNNNDDVESSSSSSEDDIDDKVAAYLDSDSDHSEPSEEDEETALANGRLHFDRQLIEKQEVADDLKRVYDRINAEDAHNKITQYMVHYGLSGIEPDWVATFNNLLSSQAQRFFRNELKKHTSDEIDKDLWLNSVVAVSHRGELLKLRDLYSLWTNCPDSDIGRDCLKYYTNRQIEMFGLENLCCYLPVDIEFETESFSKTRKEIESEPMYKRRLQRMDESTFVIGGFLSVNHWISVFVNKNEEGVIHVTNSFGPRTYKKFHERIDEEDEDINDRRQQDFRKIQTFFVTMGWGVRELVTTAMERDYQDDSFNCGVYTIEYNEQILKQIRRYKDNLANFRLPQSLVINRQAMVSGAYRWKIAETMLLPSLKQKTITYCGKHVVNEDAWTNTFDLANGPTPKKLKMIALAKDQNVVGCDSCFSLYHVDCVKDENDNLLNCFCGTKLNAESVMPYPGSEIDEEAPKALTPVKEGSSQNQTPGSNKKRERALSAQNIGSASKQQRTDQEPSSPSAMKTPKTNQQNRSGSKTNSEKRSRTPSAQKIENEKKKQRTGEKNSSPSSVNKTPVRNTDQQNRSGSKTTSGKRKGAASSENQGSSSKMPKVDNASNTSSNRPGSRKSSKNRHGKSSKVKSNAARQLFKQQEK